MKNFPIGMLCLAILVILIPTAMSFFLAWAIYRFRSRLGRQAHPRPYEPVCPYLWEPPQHADASKWQGKKTPDEWCALTGTVMYAPDGWKSFGIGEEALPAKPYSEPITFEEFKTRATFSTIACGWRLGGLKPPQQEHDALAQRPPASSPGWEPQV